LSQLTYSALSHPTPDNTIYPLSGTAPFPNLLKTHKMLSSMSRKGNSLDSAVAESFFGSLKTERVYITKYSTRDGARRDVVDTIEM